MDLHVCSLVTQQRHLLEAVGLGVCMDLHVCSLVTPPVLAGFELDGEDARQP